MGKAGASSSSSVDEVDTNNIHDNDHKIWLSNVVVKTPRRVLFRWRRWSTLDLVYVTVVLSMHVLSLFAPFCFNWSAFRVALALYYITGFLGINLSYHRNLSHRSFKLPKWLEYSFAYCGVLAFQGPPIQWVNIHRYHHQFTDTYKDPHSPIEGFWFSHMNWLFDHAAMKEKKCGVAVKFKAMDMQKQSFYRFLQRTYIAHLIALGLVLYALGGFSFIVWGMGVRTTGLYHVTWLVNSACHVWGTQSWNTGDLSRNNWWVAYLTSGEGWHNNHHAFDYSARHGLEWWQFDITWYFIRFLQAVGLATDVKVPTEAHMHKLALKASVN